MKKQAYKLIVLFTLLLIPALASAFQVGQQQSVKFSRHNLMALEKIDVGGTGNGGSMEGNYYDNFGEICVYCHTPHNASTATQAPLWNRPLPTGPYQPYSSTSMDATIRQPGGVSLACLSCHDGTIGVDSIIRTPQIKEATGNSFKMDASGGTGTCSFCHRPASLATDHRDRYLGTDLRNDHPISIVYNEAYVAQTPPEFNDPATIAPLRLFNGRVECATCHDVHKPTEPFSVDLGAGVTQRSFHLRRTAASSAICLTCHVK